MKRAIIDFETRSTIDLLKEGAWKYFGDPTTDILCLAVVVDDRKPLLWLPEWVRPIVAPVITTRGVADRRLADIVNNADIIEAHNAGFERAGWRKIMHERYGFSDIPLEKWDCSAARAAAMALPRSLEKACEVLGVSEQKDKTGHRLMMKMCKPRNPTKAEKEAGRNWECQVYWHEKPEDFVRLFKYCIQDVVSEHAISQVLRPLSRTEKHVWMLDQIINELGVHLDIPNVRAIMKTLQKHESTLLDRMRSLTEGLVSSPRQVAKLKEWLLVQGIETENLQKATVAELLRTQLPPKAKEVLEIRQALSKASTSKFKAMELRADDDQRARDLFLYCAASTGRWGGKAIQPQNMVRDSYKGANLEEAYKAFQEGDIDWINMAFDDPFPAASRCIRGSLCAAPGHELICADYNAIEARGNAWQAGEEKVLDQFRRGVCPYKTDAAAFFRISYDDVTPNQRTIGKVRTLLSGYQGGIGALSAMRVMYKIDLETLPEIVLPYATHDEIEGVWGARRLATVYLKKNPESMSLEAAMACDVLKQKWRKDNPKIVASWKLLNQAAFNAIREPGQVFRYNKVAYTLWHDKNKNPYLVCQLPSGRLLYYFSPKIKNIANDFSDEPKPSITCRTVDHTTTQWVRRPLYGGLLCENNTQALCRDFQAEAMLRLHRAGYSIVLHVHDEIMAEMPKGKGNLEDFIRIMEIVPTWAKGMPVKAEGWVGKRYRK